MFKNRLYSVAFAAAYLLSASIVLAMQMPGAVKGERSEYANKVFAFGSCQPQDQSLYEGLGEYFDDERFEDLSKGDVAAHKNGIQAITKLKSIQFSLQQNNDFSVSDAQTNVDKTYWQGRRDLSGLALYFQQDEYLKKIQGGLQQAYAQVNQELKKKRKQRMLELSGLHKPNKMKTIYTTPEE